MEAHVPLIFQTNDWREINVDFHYSYYLFSKLEGLNFLEELQYTFTGFCSF